MMYLLISDMTSVGRRKQNVWKEEMFWFICRYSKTKIIIIIIIIILTNTWCEEQKIHITDNYRHVYTIGLILFSISVK